MRFHIKGKAGLLLIFCLVLSGCAKDGSLTRWGQCAIAGAGIGGGLGGIAGSAGNSAAAPLSALGGALIGGVICALTDKEEPKVVAKAPPPKEDVVVVVEEPPKPLPATETLGSILFDFDSDKLTANAKSMLYEIAEMAKKEPGLKLTVNGYTDVTGHPTYNKGLAKRRAVAVLYYLKELRVPEDQVGLGSGGVIPDNNGNKETRKANRKVDVIGTR